MLAQRESIRDIEYLDPNKNYMDSSMQVYHVNGTMYETLADSLDQPPHQQEFAVGIHDWNVVFNDGWIHAWSNMIVKLIGNGIKENSSEVTEALEKVGEINYIRFVPIGYEFTACDDQGKSVRERRRCIEIAAWSISGTKLRMGQFYANDESAFAEFVTGVLEFAELPLDLLDDFSWDGTSCRTIQLK